MAVGFPAIADRCKFVRLSIILVIYYWWRRVGSAYDSSIPARDEGCGCVPGSRCFDVFTPGYRDPPGCSGTRLGYPGVRYWILDRPHRVRCDCPQLVYVGGWWTAADRAADNIGVTSGPEPGSNTHVQGTRHTMNINSTSTSTYSHEHSRIPGISLVRQKNKIRRQRNITCSGVDQEERRRPLLGFASGPAPQSSPLASCAG